jgi:hypothetical protein
MQNFHGMLVLRYLILLGLVAGLVFFNCRSECPPDEEPVMKTTFRVYDRSTGLSTGRLSFRRIYGLGGRGNVAANDSIAYLPLSLHADSVTYVFESAEGSRDTLILFYSRNFGPYAGNERRCGYGADFNGDSYIQGSNDTLRVINNPAYYGKSRTTFSNGSAQFRERGGLGTPIQNIYAIQLAK